MADVFISYSTENIGKAKEILDLIEQQNISCWVSWRDITKGGDFSKEIPAAIEQCSVFVLLLSEAAMRSPHILRELTLASKYRKLILPYELGSMTLDSSFEYYLENVQRINENVHGHEVLVNSICAYLRVPAQQSLKNSKEKSTQKIRHEIIIRCPECESRNLSTREGKFFETLSFWLSAENEMAQEIAIVVITFGISMALLFYGVTNLYQIKDTAFTENPILYSIYAIVTLLGIILYVFAHLNNYTLRRYRTSLFRELHFDGRGRLLNILRGWDTFCRIPKRNMKLHTFHCKSCYCDFNLTTKRRIYTQKFDSYYYYCIYFSNDEIENFVTTENITERK